MGHLTKEQRYEIKAYLKCNKKKSFIAESLNVDKSTIYREIKRNSTKTGKYNPEFAHELSEERKERLQLPRKFTNSIKKLVVKYISEEQWSPEQITGYCKANNITMVSYERIYQYIREDKFNGGNLYKNMRHKLKHRKRPVGEDRIHVKNRVSIDERPKIVDLKERFGDWELDLIVGPNNKGAILTITERTTNFFMMKKLPYGKNSKELSKILIEMLLPYKRNIYTITTDNGTEFADHEIIAKKLDADIFFTHPYSSWEKGLIEYTNKLIRQYITKNTNINTLDNEYIKEIQIKINKRPRKNLGYRNPKEIFYNLAS
ncbi:MAG: IS30 family transposase [Candidatus Woesearchaeota archaeon]